uniref:WD repeat domain 88 isoform 2 n=1 Tax=Rattus norvegicus TaxID=10116 RepID=UPI00349E819D
MLGFVEDPWRKGSLEPKMLDFVEDPWQKGSLEPKMLDIVEDSWQKDSFEAMKLDFAEYNWISIDNRRVSADSKRSSVDSKRSSVDSKRSSVDSKRGSIDSRKFSVDSKRDPVDNKRDSVDSKRFSVDSKRFSVDSRRVSISSKRSSIDSKRSSVDSRKSSGGTLLDFSEDRRSSGEDRDISSLARVRHSRVPWATLMRALGRFKLYLPHIRRYYNLSSRDPLALDKDFLLPREKHLKATVQKSWGNQQPLSKIPYKTLTGHDQTVSSCHFCMDDTRLLSSSYDCTVKLWRHRSEYSQRAKGHGIIFKRSS